MKKLGWFIGIIVVLIIVFNLFTFSVDETKKAIVMQYGNIKKVVNEPGLNFKIPFIQNVQYMEDRLLSYDIEPRKIITSDKRRLLVNNYAIWKIENPKKFKETMNANLTTAQTRIDDIVYSNLRNEFAEYEFNKIASEKRLDMLSRLTKLSSKKLSEYGINLIDVRVKRADLPEANEKAVYDRMISERKRKASQLRAEGEEKAKEIRSRADKKSSIIVSEAKEKAETIKGAGDAKALTIYSETYSQDKKFFEFWRTLDSYRKSFKKDGNSTIILSPKSRYMELLDEGKLSDKSAANKTKKTTSKKKEE